MLYICNHPNDVTVRPSFAIQANKIQQKWCSLQQKSPTEVNILVPIQQHLDKVQQVVPCAGGGNTLPFQVLGWNNKYLFLNLWVIILMVRFLFWGRGFFIVLDLFDVVVVVDIIDVLQGGMLNECRTT